MPKNQILRIIKNVLQLRLPVVFGIFAAFSSLLCGCHTKKEALFLTSAEEMFMTEAAGTEEAEREDAEREEAGTKEAETAEISADLSQLSSDTEKAEQALMMVHVCGAVKKPGVYGLPAGSRVMDAVEAAGGFSEEADCEYVNLATILQDENKVRIPSKEEVTELSNLGRTGDDNGVIEEKASTPAYAGIGIMDGQDTPDKNTKKQKVNLNTADKTLLCTLPGIGETRAESILAYRTEHGGFSRIEDIMQINGIKESSFQKIKDLITVE